MRCSVGSAMVGEKVFPGRMGRSPESRQPVHERFHTVLSPWNGPARYMTAHGTGKRRKGRSVKGIGGLAGWRIVGGCQQEAQEPCGAKWC